MVGSNKYIAFEGIEGSGKSTVCKRVAAHLKGSGADVVVVREPGGTDVGEAVREILLGDHQDPAPVTEAVLFAASRAELVETVVRPALDAGSWVLSDRTAYSSLAYQVFGRGLDFDNVRTLNDIAIGGLWPDPVVLLRLDAASGLTRQSVDDRIGGEAMEFHKRVADGFDQLAAAEPRRFLPVDATRSLDHVVADVIGRLEL